MVLSLDFGAIWEGFHGDAAVTVFVGGQAPSEEAAKLAKETEHALYAAIDAIRVGGRLSDIGHTIESVADAAGLGVVREYGGHGIGRSMHEEPFIQNWGPAGRGPELRPGLTIAVEPMFTLGGEENRVLADGWTVVTTDGSLAAHFEHTIAITEDGPEILTTAIEAELERGPTAQVAPTWLDDRPVVTDRATIVSVGFALPLVGNDRTARDVQVRDPVDPAVAIRRRRSQGSSPCGVVPM